MSAHPVSPKAKPRLCETVVAIQDEPHHHLAADSGFARAYHVEVPGRQRTLCHSHAHEYLMFVAGDAQIASIPLEGEPRQHRYEDRYCEFSPSGVTHVVENLTDVPFRNLIVEFLPGAEQKHRAGLPFSNVGGVRVSHLFSGEKACVELFEFQGGAQAQVTGPAIVASPYGDTLELITPQEGVRKIKNFSDLALVSEGATGMLRCEADSPARAVVISIGNE